MINFLKHRSFEPEMMDEDGIHESLLKKNLDELDILNRISFSHYQITNQLKKIITNKNQVYRIADFGCGSGDLLKFIARWGRKNGFQFKLFGIDNNPQVIAHFNNHCKEFHEIEGILAAVHSCFSIIDAVDVSISSLFLHHLNNDEIVSFLRLLNKHSNQAILISDLKRNILAYLSSWLFPRIFNGSILAKNDGPLSVLKSLKKCELEALLEKAGIPDFKIKNQFPFRYLLSIAKQ